MIIKQLFSIAISVFSASLLAATDAVSSNNNSIDGAKVYAENCSICHGDAGDGNTRAKGSLRPPPRNFTTVNAALELSRERMLSSVINGRPGTGMMPHKDRLSMPEIEAVVDYIRANFMKFPSDKNSKQVTAMAEGEKIYSKHCSVCHGDKGTTAIWARSGLQPMPRDFTTAEARTELTKDRMIASVTNGRPGTAMMPHKDKLSKKEIEQVVNYIRTSFMSGPVAIEPAQQQSPIAAHRNVPGMNAGQQRQGHPQIPGFSGPAAGNMTSPQARANRDPHQRQNPHAGGIPGISMPSTVGPVASADMSAPMPKGLKGDASKGKAFYMSNCFTCHGVKGDGNGPRAHFNTPRPRNFTSEASRRMLNRERLFNSITNGKVGTVMPAWGKVLNDQQIANVAEFVFNTFVSSDKEKTKDAKGAKDKNAGAGIPSNKTASLDKKKAK
ncbi:c-type cytochrome [Kaarinaea lacus]